MIATYLRNIFRSIAPPPANWAEPRGPGIKLNLGCGRNKLAGFVNVDKYADADRLHDLEVFPWPCPDSAADEVVLNHVLEHLGATPAIFRGVLRELYRVCAPGAKLRIVVPHPRHDDFLGDPTHVRAITPELLSLFSRRNCELWAKQGAANSPLALHWGVDFEIRETHLVLEEPWASDASAGRIDQSGVDRAVKRYNNVVKEIRMTLEAVKESAGK